MAHREPEALIALNKELERLPGIGARTASRLAHHLLRVSKEEAMALAHAIQVVRETIHPCSGCQSPTDVDPCPICTDETRDRETLLVVETARVMGTVEAAGHYRGLYFVLGDRLRPADGVDAGSLALEALRARVLSDAWNGVRIKEVCMGTNPDLEGDGAVLTVSAQLEGLDVRLTQLARGIPSGGQIEYQSATAIADAIDGRVPIQPS